MPLSPVPYAEYSEAVAQEVYKKIDEAISGLPASQRLLVIDLNEFKNYAHIEKIMSEIVRPAYIAAGWTIDIRHTEGYQQEVKRILTVVLDAK